MAKSKKFFIAYFWNMLGKLCIRSMGIISTLILVRLLSPDDFGIIAIATMFIGFFNVLTNAGVNRYLILHPTPSDDLYHSGWTLNLCLRFLAFTIVFISAPFFAEYVMDKRLIIVLRLVGLIGFIDALKSIELIKFEKAIEFGPFNKINIFAKLFSSTATILTAFYYRSYYALIVGNFVLTISVVILSYSITHTKPKVNFNIDRKIFNFSWQMLLRNIFGYSRSQIDVLLVGKQFDAQSLGGFTIARNFSIMPQTEIVDPAIQPVFSVLSLVKESKKIFFEKIYQTLFFTYLFLTPAAIGFYVMAESFVYVVLGRQWEMVTNYLGILSFLMLPYSTQPILSIVYDVFEKTKLSLFADLFGLVAIILLFYWLTPPNVAGFVDLRVSIGLVMLFISIGLVKLFVGFDLKRYFLIFFIPLALSSFMGCIIYALNGYFKSAVANLFIMAGTGVLIYSGIIVLFFYAIILLNPKAWLLSLIPQIVYSKINKIFPGWLAKRKVPRDYYSN